MRFPLNRCGLYCCLGDVGDDSVRGITRVVVALASHTTEQYNINTYCAETLTQSESQYLFFSAAFTQNYQTKRGSN